MIRPIWLRPSADLSERERQWMAWLSQDRVRRFGPIPRTGAEWVEQIERCAADIKAEREARQAA